MDIGTPVIIKKIVPTGARNIPNGLVGKTGKVISKRYHHGREWIVVVFKQEKHSFSHMCFGNVYHDFLEDELEELNNAAV